MDPAAELMDFDLATVEKLPVIARLLAEGGAPAEPCLDIGVGTGTTTRRLFAGRRTIALDAWRPNLAPLPADELWRVQASGDRLPLADGSIGTILCSEVLEHVEDDVSLMREMARVLKPGGVAVITVPSMYYGFDSYLHLVGIQTVHDFPGPERHVRPGYTEEQLGEMAHRSGLEVTRVEYVFGPCTKLAMEAVSLAHIVYQRAVHGRRSWSWADVAEPSVASGAAFGVYRRLFPILRALGSLDRLLPTRGGFGLAMQARKPAR